MKRIALVAAVLALAACADKKEEAPAAAVAPAPATTMAADTTMKMDSAKKDTTTKTTTTTTSTSTTTKTPAPAKKPLSGIDINATGATTWSRPSCINCNNFHGANGNSCTMA